MNYAVTTSPSFSTLPDGLTLVFKAASAGTGNDQINVNNTGFFPLFKSTAGLLTVSTVSGDILAGAQYAIIWNDANSFWTLVNPSSSTFSGLITAAAGIDVTGGLITAAAGIDVTGGLITAAAGIDVTGGLITAAAGIDVTGGTVVIPPATSPNQAVNLGQFVNSFNSNGYAKLPGGLIIQWGSVIANGTTTVTFNFPITLPNAVFSLVGSIENQAVTYTLEPISSAQGQLTLSGAGAPTLLYIVIGY